MDLLDYKALGMRIRQQRKKLKMTQEDLAKKAGISVSFLGHIERGSRKASLETLLSISSAVEATPDELLRDSLSQFLMLKSSPPSQGQRDLLYEISRLILKEDDCE